MPSFKGISGLFAHSITHSKLFSMKGCKGSCGRSIQGSGLELRDVTSEKLHFFGSLRVRCPKGFRV